MADSGGDVHICGVGMAECAAVVAALLARHKPDLALLAGIAGTCSDHFAIGDTVAVETETIADLGRRNPDGTFTPLFQKTYPATHIPEGFPIAQSHTVNCAGRNTGGGPTGTSSGTDSCEVVVENMEGAAFFAVCERFGVPAAEIRTISNRVGEPVTRENLDLAACSLAAALKKLLL